MRVQLPFYLCPTITNPEYQLQKKNCSQYWHYSMVTTFLLNILSYLTLHFKSQVKVYIYMFIYKLFQKQIIPNLGPRVSALGLVQYYAV